MLKIAVVGAGSLLGRELVDMLEPRECSVLPLSHGPMTRDEEFSDLVMFAPEASLLEGIELVILAETPAAPELLTGYAGKVLDLRDEPEASLDPMPLVGAWPKGTPKSRDWWYRMVEEPQDIELALRFSLSQQGVAAVIPASFLDLLDRCITAAKAFKPLDETAVAQLKQMAAGRDSLFLGEEQQVALNSRPWTPLHPDSPHEA